MKFFIMVNHFIHEFKRITGILPDTVKKFRVQGVKCGQEDIRSVCVGKGDAVRKGFAAATGDVLVIQDADLTAPPEDLPKFFRALRDGKGEYINGSRLVYPMQKQAMRFLNLLANKFFGTLFS